MHILKKLTLACAVSLVSLSTTYALAGEKFVVGFANMADTDVFIMKRKNSFIEAAKSDPDIEIKFTDANEDMIKQLDQIDNLIAQKVDAIIVSPVDYEGVVPGIENANAAGIPVVTYGIAAAGGEYTLVGSPNYDAGKLQAEYMHEILPENAEILYLQGTPGMYHSIESKSGFLENLNRPDVKIIASLPADYNRAKGMQITEDWIQRFPKFDAIIAADDQMALGAREALLIADRLDGVIISGVNGDPEALDAITKGEMAQTIFQNAKEQGNAVFEVIAKIKNGETPPKEIMIPYETITAKNVTDYIE